MLTANIFSHRLCWWKSPYLPVIRKTSPSSIFHVLEYTCSILMKLLEPIQESSTQAWCQETLRCTVAPISILWGKKELSVLSDSCGCNSAHQDSSSAGNSKMPTSIHKQTKVTRSHRYYHSLVSTSSIWSNADQICREFNLKIQALFPAKEVVLPLQLYLNYRVGSSWR